KAMISACEVSGVKKPLTAGVAAAKRPAAMSVALKPVAANTRRATNLTVSAPIAPAKVITPDWNGLTPTPGCSINGIRKGTAPVEMRKIVLLVVAVRKASFLKIARLRIGEGCRPAWRT